MLKRLIVILAVGMFVNLSISPIVFAADLNEKELVVVEKVRSQVIKLGTGKDVTVEVKLNDGTKLQGYISESNAESFAVVDKSGGMSTVSYPAVKQISSKKRILGLVIVVTLLAVPLIILAVENGRCKRGTGPCS